jgi:hypothetical protein
MLQHSCAEGMLMWLPANTQHVNGSFMRALTFVNFIRVVHMVGLNRQ